MAYNQSRIRLFRKCQKAYSFRYDYAELYGGSAGQELVPKVSKVGFYRGTWMHMLLQVHHKLWAGEEEVEIKVPKGRGQVEETVTSWEEAQELLTHEYDENLFEEEKEELDFSPDDCKRLFRSYLKFWEADDKRYTVAKLHDGSPAVEFIIEVSLEKWGITIPFKGQVDLLVEDNELGGLWIWDHKWVKTVPGDDERMMSPQALIYAWALRKLGYDVRGFVFNYGRTKAPTIPRLLKNGTLSLAKNIDTDEGTYLQAIKDLHGKRWKEYATTVYAEKLADLKNREVLWFRRERIALETPRVKQGLGEFLATIQDIERRRTGKLVPRTYQFSCGWKKGGCEYHGLCVSEFNGLDILPLIKKKFIFEGERYGEKVEEG